MKAITFILSLTFFMIVQGNSCIANDIVIEQTHKKASCAIDTKEKCVIIYTQIVSFDSIIWSDTLVGRMPDLKDLLTLHYEKAETILSEYEAGWEDGFCEGWKHVKGQFAVCPLVPFAPIPELNCMSGYTCGYNRGFIYGICRARGNYCTK